MCCSESTIVNVFFSSRRRHTRYWRDWSSDVCSSDLRVPASSGKRFLELAGTLGLGIALRQATRELAKLIPIVGSVAGGALGGASTYALGKAFCFYFEAVHKGHVPRPDELRHYYRDQLAMAEEF